MKIIYINMRFDFMQLHEKDEKKIDMEIRNNLLNIEISLFFVFI